MEDRLHANKWEKENFKEAGVCSGTCLESQLSTGGGRRIEL
jgi:hypothetical protein